MLCTGAEFCILQSYHPESKTSKFFIIEYNNTLMTIIKEIADYMFDENYMLDWTHKEIVELQTSAKQIRVSSWVAERGRINNLGKLRNSQNFRELLPSAWSSSRKKNFFSSSEKLLKNTNWTFSVVRYFTWKLEFVSNILWMIVSGNIFLLLFRPRPLHLLTIFVILRPQF